MSPNDENTRATIHAVSDQAASLFSHFFTEGGTWENFTYGQSDLYLERLKLGLDQLSMCVQAELHRRILETPTELGV